MTSLVLAIGLAVSVAGLPKGAGGGSVVGSWLSGGVRTHCGQSFDLMALRTPKGFVITDQNAESADGLTKALRDRPDDVFNVNAFTIKRLEGFYALTRCTARVTVEVTCLGSLPGPSAQDAREIREAAAGWMEQDGGLEDWKIQAVRAGGVTHQTSIRSGYVYNAWSLACLGVFLWSCAWVPRAARSLPSSRARRWLNQGRCPGCGYELRGLSGGVCPECGTTKHSMP